jgi:S-adenosylmethionine decarboxylase
MHSVPELGEGVEWLVDAHACDPAALRDAGRLEAVFLACVEELGLHPLEPARFHRFPGPGGVTGMLMLSESHLTCHSFPESAYAAFNLYCCRPRPDWPWAERLQALLGAAEVKVRRLDRPMRAPGGTDR